MKIEPGKMRPLCPINSKQNEDDIKWIEESKGRVESGETVGFILLEVGQSGEIMTTIGGSAKGCNHAFIYGLETVKFKLLAGANLERI